MLLDRVLKLRGAGAVQRLHTMRTVGRQSLAEHSWGVAMLVWHVAPEAPGHVFAAALVHDLHEWWTGDVPAPCKWAHEGLEKELRTVEAQFDAAHGLDIVLLDRDRALLKWCDQAELALYAFEQRMMGNMFMAEVERNIVRAMQHRGEPPEVCRALWDQMRIRGIGAC